MSKNEEIIQDQVEGRNAVLELLESGKLSLEDSVEIYKKGMALSIECKKRLDSAKEVVVKKVATEA